MRGKHNSENKPKDFKKTIKKLLEYLKEYKVGIIFIIIFSVFSSIFSIVGPKILGKATTEISLGLISKLTTGIGINFPKIKNIILILAILYLISAIFSYLQSFIMAGISNKISYGLRKEIVLKINKMPLKYFESKTTGEILSRLINDVDVVSNNLSQTLTQVISSITTLIGVLIMMLSISPTMTLASILILPIGLLLIAKTVGKSQKYFTTTQEYIGHINSQVEEIYGGHSIIKTYNAKDTVTKKFDETNEVLYNSSWKSQFLSGMMHPIMNFIGNLGYVLVAILGGYLTIKGKIEIGYILSFTQYIRSFNQPIASIASIANIMQSTVAASERVFEFLDSPEEVKSPSKTDTTNIKGNVEFKNVKFGYDKNKIIINDFNIKVKQGEKIAIVGPTGAGKTTIVKLLMRFYDTTSGEILIDNTNIKEFNRQDLRDLFGMVLQDTWLFNGTIKENIRYGKLDATDEEVIKACQSAHIDHFIKTLPDSYNHVIDEETTNISSGQKQLLTIARVILKNPKILILDEATSNVDTRTEILIQKAMDHLMENRTSFIIAHRLSTIQNANKIIVMDKGDIIEIGKHKELLKKKGFYYNLYNANFDNEEE